MNWNKILHPIKSLKEASRIAELKEKERLETDLKNTREMYQYSKQTMLNKPCPISKNKCYAECVHFMEGGVTDKPINFMLNEVKQYYFRKPKCKLWK